MSARAEAKCGAVARGGINELFLVRIRRTDLALRVSGIALAGALAAAASPAFAQDATAGARAERPGDDRRSGQRHRRHRLPRRAGERDGQEEERGSGRRIGHRPRTSASCPTRRSPNRSRACPASPRSACRAARNIISIRGFAPDFSTTLLNGREQTSTGDNRAVEYDQYPSEVINQVLVYKTADGVDRRPGPVGHGRPAHDPPARIRQARPVGRRARHLRRSRQAQRRVEAIWATASTATYVDQFANDTVGVALSASYVDEPYQIREFNAWGYDGGARTAPRVIGGPEILRHLDQAQAASASQGTIEWQPTANFTSTIDALLFGFQGRPDQARHRTAARLAADATSSGQ